MEVLDLDSVFLLGGCFNPSGSMDYFGRNIFLAIGTRNTGFQSFWFNGLLWKLVFKKCPGVGNSCFNPSGSMDYFGSKLLNLSYRIDAGFNPSGSMDYFGRRDQRAAVDRYW